MSTNLSQARRRVTAFLEQRNGMLGIDPDVITTANLADLRTEDLKELLVATHGMTEQLCPSCHQTVHWDEDHDPPAWRHDHGSRWCMLDVPRSLTTAVGDFQPVYPAGATDPHRKVD